MSDIDLLLQRLKGGEKNFHRVSMSGCDVSGMDLEGVDFGNSDLRDTSFNRCVLNNANFSRANLAGASFVGATLINANFSEANLTEANMSYADLRRATLARAMVRSVNMAKADLRGTDLRVKDGNESFLPPWQSMTLSSAIFNSTTKAQKGLAQYGAIRELFLPLVAIGQSLSSNPSLTGSEQAIYRKAAEIWTTGSFYVLLFILLITALALISRNIPWYTFLSVLVASILTLLIIGTLILRHLDELDQKGFIQLMVEVLKRLPILGTRDIR